MAKPVIRVSEAEASRNLASLLVRVHAGVEVVIERDRIPIAVLRSLAPITRTLADCIALLPEDSTATIDEDFSRDIEAIVASHQEQ